ncbi:MAG: YdcH family protein [Neomegalonema sp.]|nr:YdcH family protein [Neomegalonema sp.]
MTEMSRDEVVRVKLTALLAEHRRLNEKVDLMAAEVMTADLELQRLKKRRLALKDEIAALQDRLTPDIIA